MRGRLLVVGFTKAVGCLCAGVLLAGALVTGAWAGETSIRFTLDSKIEGTSAPFLLPLDKGYYRTEGLNVGIDEATDSLEAIQRIASGNYDMGVVDLNGLIRARDANPKTPLKAVFIVYNRPAFAVIARRSRGVDSPKDLEGKRLGAPPKDAAFAQWPIFAKLTGIDAAKVAVENISGPVREPMLAAGQVDAITGLSYHYFISLKAKGVPVDDIVVLLMADYGVDLYGDAIVVNESFAATHREAVEGFLRAFLKGLKQAVNAPASAIEPVLRRDDGARRDLEVERLTMAVRDNIVTPQVKANGFGGLDDARFARAIEQTALAYRFRSAKPQAADVFDASYLPPAAERNYP